MIRTGILAAVLSATTSLVALAQTADDLKNDANTPDDVLVYGMGYQGQRYSSLTQINKQNVGKLVPVWSYSLNDLQGGEGFPIVKDGVIITRPLSRAILPGIRRRVLLELGPRHGLAIDERPFTVAEALAADEAMLTSASNFVLPGIAIDGKPIGTGTPGPVARRLREIYIAAALKEAGVG